MNKFNQIKNWKFSQWIFNKIPYLKELLLPIYLKFQQKRRKSCYDKSGLKVLKDFDDLMTKHHIHYSVFAGTLLGAVREKGFLKHDIDIDTVMFDGDYNARVRNLLYDKGFRLLRSFEVEDGTIGREETYIKDGVTIDIYFIYEDDKFSTYQCDFLIDTSSIHKKDGVRIGRAYVRRLEFPVSYDIVRLPFETITVNALANYSEWLSYRYGKDYMIPNPNFKDKGDNPNIFMWEGKIAIVKDYDE